MAKKLCVLCESNGDANVAQDLLSGAYQVSFGDLFCITRLYRRTIAVLVDNACKAGWENICKGLTPPSPLPYLTDCR